MGRPDLICRRHRRILRACAPLPPLTRPPACWCAFARRWEVPALAEHFRIRQQRVMAIVALKEREHAARQAGIKLHTELAGGGRPPAGGCPGAERMLRTTCLAAWPAWSVPSRPAWCLPGPCGAVPAPRCVRPPAGLIACPAPPTCLAPPSRLRRAEALEDEFGAHHVVGSGEWHHVVLPSFPNFKVGRGGRACVRGR